MSFRGSRKSQAIREQNTKRRAAGSSSNSKRTVKMKNSSMSRKAATGSDPRIIEFIDQSNGRQFDSKVPIRQPLFEATPAEINIQEYDPFGVYKIKIHLRNRDKVARRVQIADPNSHYFSLSTKRNVKNKIAPMMEILYTLTFKPRKKKDYEVDLIVMTEREKFVIPVRATGDRAFLTVPEEINFFDCPVYHKSERTFLLNNTGPKDTAYRIDTTPPFSVSPSSGNLSKGEGVSVSVSFNPPLDHKFTGQLVVNIGDNQRLYSRVIGTGRCLDIGISAQSLTAPTTYIYLKSHTTLEIRNNGDMPVEFEWKNILSRSAEYEKRRQIEQDLQKREEEELEILDANVGNDDGSDVSSDEETDHEYKWLVARQELTRKYKSLREESLKNFQFEHKNFTVDPIKGEVFPGGVREVTFTFIPDNAVSFKAQAVLQVDGMLERVPVTLKGAGLGPKAKFLFDSLDVGKVYINAVHNYSIELENIGQIDVDYHFETMEGSRFSCNPTQGKLGRIPDNTASILFTFSADKKGKFEETVKCWLKGNQEPLTITLKGVVIGPTFFFEQKMLDWGNVSYGFLRTKEVSIVNSSEIPMRFSLRVPEDEKYMQREFKMVPPTGQILPNDTGKVRVDFVPQTKKKYNGYNLSIDVDGVGKNLKSIPMFANCKVPEFVPGVKEIDFGEIFRDYPYTQPLPLLNSNELPGRFEVKGQQEITEKLAKVKFNVNAGSVPADSELELKCTILGRTLGAHEIPISMRIPGSSKMPTVMIRAVVIGPKVSLDKTRVTWKKIEVLKPNTQTITLKNLSLIPANYKAFVRKKKSCFRINVSQGKIEPNGSLEVQVTAILDDFNVTIKDRLMIVIEDGKIIDIPLVATGVGSTIQCKENIETVDMGHVFTVDKARQRFEFQNRGRRQHQLMWHYVDPHAEEKKKEKDKGNNNSNAEEEVIHTTFNIKPEKVILKPNMAIQFQVDGKCGKPGVKAEQWKCMALVQGSNKPIEIYNSTFTANFVVPLLEFSEPELSFIQRCEPGVETAPGKKLLSVKNVSPLPLVFWMKCPPPFSIDRLEYELGPGESATSEILFTANLSDERQSLKVKTNLTITYRDHTQKDKLPLRGEVCFPNLIFSAQRIDFGCVLNETSKKMRLLVTNVSKVVAYYNWSFMAPDDLAFQVIQEDANVEAEAKSSEGLIASHSANEIFDIVPIRGRLDPGEKEWIDFIFYGHMNALHEAVAVCEVLGGPEYQISLKGEASAMLYTLEKTSLDFGEHEMEYKKAYDIYIQNVGKVDFPFSIDTSTLKFPAFAVTPSRGTLKVGRKKRLNVRYRGGIPAQLEEVFRLRVAYFNPIEISLTAKGVFPQIVTDLSRDPEDQSYKPRLEYATDTILLNMFNSSPDMLLGQTPLTGVTRASTASKTTRRAIIPVNLSLEHMLVREADRLAYFDYSTKDFSSANKGKRGGGKKLNPGAFTVSNYLVDFGHIILGSKKTVSFNVTNVGTMPALVEYQKRDIANTMFHVQGSSPAGVPPEHSYKLKVICSPTPGVDEEGVSIVHMKLKVKNAPAVNIRLRALVEVPVVEVSTQMIDFGEVYAGMRKHQFLVLRNNNPVQAKWELRVGRYKNIFSVTPNKGTIAPKSSLTVTISFSPRRNENYKTNVTLGVKMNDETTTIMCKGRGLVKGIRIEPDMLSMGPMLPYKRSEPKLVKVYNDSATPIEIMSLDFDEKLKDEDEVLSGIVGYTNNRLYLEPRKIGQSLPDKLLRQYKIQKHVNKLEEEARREKQKAEILESAYEALMASPEDAKTALEQKSGEDVDAAGLHSLLTSKSVYITKKQAKALVQNHPSENGPEFLNLNALVEAIAERLNTLIGAGEEEGEDIKEDQKAEEEKGDGVVGELQMEEDANQAEDREEKIDTSTMDSRNILIVGGPKAGKTTLSQGIASSLNLEDKLITLDKAVEFFLNLPDEQVAEDADPKIIERQEIKKKILLQMEGKDTARSKAEGEEAKSDEVEEKDGAEDNEEETAAEQKEESEDKTNPSAEEKEGDSQQQEGEKENASDSTSPAEEEKDVDHGILDDKLINHEVLAKALSIYLSLSVNDLRHDDVGAQGDEAASQYFFEEGVIIDGLDCKFVEGDTDAAKAVFAAFDMVRSQIPSERDPNAIKTAFERVVSPLPHGDVKLPGEDEGMEESEGKRRTAKLNVFLLRPKYRQMREMLQEQKKTMTDVIADEGKLDGFAELDDKALNKLQGAEREEYDEKVRFKAEVESAKKFLSEFEEIESKVSLFYKHPDVEEGQDHIQRNPGGPGFQKLLLTMKELGHDVPLSSLQWNVPRGANENKYKQMTAERRKTLDDGLVKKLTSIRASLFGSQEQKGPATMESLVSWVRFNRIRYQKGQDSKAVIMKLAHHLREPFPEQKNTEGIAFPPVLLQAYRRPDSSQQLRGKIENFRITLHNSAGGAEDGKDSGGDAKAADEEGEEGKRPKSFRWTIPANSYIELAVDFSSTTAGKFNSRLGLMVVGDTREYSLLCSGVCAVPQISQEPRSVFMRRAKTQRPTSILTKQYVMDAKFFQFGPLLIGKDAKTRNSNDEAVIEALRKTNSDTFRITNTGLFDCHVDFSIMGQLVDQTTGQKNAVGVDAHTFIVEPKALDLKVDEMKEVTVWAFPTEAKDYKDSLLCSVHDNPVPVVFDLGCEGSAPKLELSLEKVEFSRLLVGQVDTLQVVLKNPAKLPIKWEIKKPQGEDAKDFENFFVVNPSLGGVMRPMSSTTLMIDFQAKEEKKVELELNVEYQDAEEVFDIERKPLFLVAEAFEMSVKPEWPEGNDGIDFGTIKVNQQMVRNFSISNEGKYPITFDFLINNRKKRFYNEILKIEPMSGRVESGEKQEFTLSAQAKREVHFNNSSDIKLVVLEPETQDKQPALPIKMHFRSVFSKFAMLPNHGVDFGPLETGTDSEKQIEIENDGVFDFQYQIFEAGSDGVEPLQEVFDEKNAPNIEEGGELELGPFLITGIRGVVPAKGKKIIKVRFKAGEIREYNRSLEIDICQRDKLQFPRVLYELMGEGCSPGIVASNYASIFEEQSVLRRLDPLHPLTSNAFTIEEPERVFHFAPVVANGKNPSPKERFRISNPYKVPCNVSISVEIKGDEGGKGDEKKEPAFVVTPEALHIPPHEHRFATVQFNPQGLSTCTAVFTATVERGTHEPSKCLTFGLTGEGILPSISVEEPTERDSETSAVLLNFSRMPLLKNDKNTKTKTIVLRNDMTVLATARFDMDDTTQFSFSGRGKLIDLNPGESVKLTVDYHPSEAGVHDVKIAMKILQNPFEMTAFRLLGECFEQDVTLEGLDMSESKGDELQFGDVVIGKTVVKTFKMANTSSLAHRFEWKEDDIPGQFKFIPRIGHLQPQESKEIRVSFMSEETSKLEDQKVSCTIKKIKYVEEDAKDGEEEKQNENKEGAAESAKKTVNWDDTMEADEPNFEEVEDENKDAENPGLDLVMHAVADNSRYELDETITKMQNRITFAPTMMFQKRTFRFTLKNKSTISMPFSWRFGETGDEFKPESFVFSDESNMDDGEEGSMNAAEPKSLTLWEIRGVKVDDSKTFKITPSNGVIEPLQDQLFTVQFSPMRALHMEKMLGGFIKHLTSDQKQPVISFTATGLRPKCHFELVNSDYLQAGRRPADMRDTQGRLGALDPLQYRVLEFKSLGTQVRNTRKFYVVNPTNQDYSFQWVFEGVSMKGSDGKTGAIPNPFRCLTSQGVVMAGRKAEIVFEFLPQFEQLTESYWQFRIPEQDIYVSMLIVGQVVEPDVILDRTHINFRHMLLGARSKETLYLINNEHLPFSYQINFEQENKSRPVLDISPASGVIPAESRIPLSVVFRPRAEKVYNFNVEFDIKKKPGKVSLNVKGQGFRILSLLEYQEADPSGLNVARKIMEPDMVNRLDFGVSYVCETRVKRLSLTNAGQFPFDFEWSLGNSRFLAAKPPRGKLQKGDTATVDLIFHSEREVSFNELPIYLNIGPQRYTVSLSGRAKKPRLHFSFQRWSFGPCFLSREGVPSASHELTVVNNEVTNIELDCNFQSQPHLTIEHQATVLAPGESIQYPIKFFPQEIRKYRDEVLFEVNGSYKVPVIIAGEGVPIRLALLKESDKLVNLGEIRSGQQSVRIIQLANLSRIAARFKLTVPEAVISRIKKLHGISDDKKDANSEMRLATIMEDPLSSRLDEFCVRYQPTSFVTLRPKQNVRFEFIFNPDRPMPKFREDVLIDVVGQTPQKLLTLAGACFGIGARLDTNSVPFGPIVEGTKLVKTVLLENIGEAGIRYSWQTGSIKPNFTIKPEDGFVPPKERVSIEVTFHPVALDNDIRVDKVPCLIDKQIHPNMNITLTGACVVAKSSSEKLLFSCPVRQPQKKTVSVQNTTPNDWDDLKVQINNPYWYGKKEIKVPAKSEVKYDIWYKPLSMTAAEGGGGNAPPADVKDGGAASSSSEFKRPDKHRGKLFFALPNGKAILYELEGTASEASPEKKIEVKCKCKRTEMQGLLVNNWLNTHQGFDVKIDVGGDDKSVQVTGPKSLDVPEMSSREYKLKFFAYRAGTTNVSVTFTNPKTKENVRYELEFVAGDVQEKVLPLLETCVRRRKVIGEEIYNPLDEQVTVSSFSCEDPGIFVQTPIVVPPKGSSRIKIVYNPLVVSARKDGVKLSVASEQLGEFVYSLSLSATEAGTDTTMRFTTDLGSQAIQTYHFRSFATEAADAEYECEIKGSEFTVPTTVTAKVVAAGSDGADTAVDVCYEPSNMGGVRDTLVIKSKGKAGMFQVALIGKCDKPKRKGPVEVKAGSSATIEFKNVLSEDAEYTFSINNPAFTLGSTTAKIAKKDKCKISISYSPSEDSPGFDVGNLLIVCKKMKHPWIYYVRGSK